MSSRSQTPRTPRTTAKSRASSTTRSRRPDNSLVDRLGPLSRHLTALQVVLPHVDVYRVARRCLGAPQLACGEAYRVHVLQLLAKPVDVGVRKHEHAVVAHDRAVLAARVARQPRMGGRMDVACS